MEETQYSSIFSVFYAFFAVPLYYIFSFDKIESGKRYIRLYRQKQEYKGR